MPWDLIVETCGLMLDQFLEDYRQLVPLSSEPASTIDLSAFINEYKLLPADRKKAPKSFLDIIRRPFDENTISDYLAYLLDFDHSDESLQILSWLWNRGSEQKVYFEKMNITTFRIKREHTFLDSGRIDLLVFINGKYLLAVENKIFAGEGLNQTQSYAASLDDEHPEYAKSMILLSPSNLVPSSDRFVSVCYPEFIQYLRQVPFAEKLNASVAENFIYHFEEHFMNPAKFSLSEKALLYLRHKREIEDVRTAFEKDSESIFETAMSFPLKYLSQETRTTWQDNTNPGRHYQQFTKEPWEARNDIYIHFEYYVTAESLLTPGSIELMIHVEGKNNGAFFKGFEPVLEKLSDEYKTKGLEYRPKNNRNALATKVYSYEIDPAKLDPSAMDAFFRSTIDDFLFLIPVIDKLMAKQ